MGGVKVGVVNVNSLRNKLSYLQNLITLYNLCALGISETWLTGDTPSSFVELNGFNFFITDVVGTVKKHGVGLYLNSDLKGVSDDIVVSNVLSVFARSWDLHIVVVYIALLLILKMRMKVFSVFFQIFAFPEECYYLAILIYLRLDGLVRV